MIFFFFSKGFPKLLILNRDRLDVSLSQCRSVLHWDTCMAQTGPCRCQGPQVSKAQTLVASKDGEDISDSTAFTMLGIKIKRKVFFFKEKKREEIKIQCVTFPVSFGVEQKVQVCVSTYLKWITAVTSFNYKFLYLHRDSQVCL